MLTRRELTLTEQFVGPPNLGNGGYVVGYMAGVLADDKPEGHVYGAGAFEVTLRAPLPINAGLQTLHEDDGLKLLQGETLLATARASALDLVVPLPASVEAARAHASSSLSLKPGFHQTLGERIGVHPICFCCGAERGESDGLRVFPAACDGDEGVTALWTPHECFAGEDGLIGPEIICAAIDCPGAFAFLENDQRAGLLGRMTVEFLKPLRAGDETRILGWRLGEDGRKMLAGTALFDSEGDLVAKAKQVWFGFPG